MVTLDICKFDLGKPLTILMLVKKLRLSSPLKYSNQYLSALILVVFKLLLSEVDGNCNFAFQTKNLF